MKNILITGAGGFIGSHLTEICVKAGYNVKAFIHYNSNNYRGWLEGSLQADQIEFVTGDVRDYDAVYRHMKGCDTVLHLAALIGIPYSYYSPLAYIKTNIEGTYNVLQAAKELGLNKVITTSTSETYGTAQYVPIDEKHPAVGQSPYAATKVAADQISLSFHRSFGLPVSVVRPFNTYGPRQSARAIIPTIISQLAQGKKEIKLGSLGPTRDFTFVIDTASAILAVAQSNKFLGEAVNIGTNTEISIGDLVKTVMKIMNKKARIVEDKIRVRPQKSEVERLNCDNTKITGAIKWRPKVSFEDGLRQTIQFINDNQSFYKPEIYNV